MIAKIFIDTNILLYAGSKAPEDRSKKAIARVLLAQPNIGFSAQVMQEFYTVAVKKERLKMTHEEAKAVLHTLNPFPILPISYELVLKAIGLKVHYLISYWDAAILAAAHQLGCDILYSEDLNHGQEYDSVRVINPFLESLAV